MKAKVKFVVDIDREAGNSSTGPPPKDWVGQEVNVGRPLVGWHAYWVEKDGVKVVMSHAELDLPECKCGTCKDMREYNATDIRV
jgi:hypothetical protein